MSGKSLFASPAFILTETSFIIVAALAAYELLVGDFIWAQQEEARRASVQSRRDRGGYDSLGGRPPQLQGHRSLSPGGRGRGGQRPPSRRTSNEELPLLYSSRARTQEGYYSSPGDTRYASPGRGSTGDSTRRLFYKVVLFALLSRFLLLPMETFYYDNHTTSSNIIPNSTLLQIILRIIQTLPDVIFASALGLLIIFCAQIAFAAMPPVTPPSNEGSVHGDGDTAATLEEGAESGSLLGDGGSMKQQERVGTGNRLERSPKKARYCCISMSRLSRTILASEKTFAVWNIILAASYVLVFVAAPAVPRTPHSNVDASLWLLLVAIHAFLLLSLIYVAVLLGRALFPGIVRRKSKDSLAFRLIGTCTMIAIMLIDRVVCFSIQANGSVVDLQSSDHEERIHLGSYRRSTIEYAISESLPILAILFLMHRKRKELHHDVLISHSINSIMTNLFGSTTQLDPATTPEAGNTAVARASGLGSRRFQTYGGARGDSFPPTSGKARRNTTVIPKAVSSSGGRGLDPKSAAGAAKPNIGSTV